MAKTIEFRQPRSNRNEDDQQAVSLSGEKEALERTDMKGLIDDWLVPVMVEDWMEQNANEQGSDDNGEQS